MFRPLLFSVTLYFMLYAACPAAVAQASTDLDILRTQCRERTQADPRQKENAHKQLFFPTSVLFGFYRTVLSEQIAADCAFDLTCSRFSIAAIRRFGLVKGGLLTTDRLTRCHTFVAQETVPLYFNNQTGKVIDVPAMY